METVVESVPEETNLPALEEVPPMVDMVPTPEIAMRPLDAMIKVPAKERLLNSHPWGPSYLDRCCAKLSCCLPYCACNPDVQNNVEYHHDSTCLHSLMSVSTFCCSKYCRRCWGSQRPVGVCPGHCDHLECKGIFGGWARDIYARRCPCILAAGHPGDCLCSGHAPIIRVDISIYRPFMQGH